MKTYNLRPDFSPRDFLEMRAGYLAERKRPGMYLSELEYGLLDVHEFVEKIRSTTFGGYSIFPKDGTVKFVERPLSRYKLVGAQLTDPFLTHFDLSPQINAFRGASSLFREPPYTWQPDDVVSGMHAGRRFNIMIEDIRRRTLQPSFAAKVKQRRNAVIKDCESADTLIRHVAARVRHLQVLRFDLRFRAGCRIHETGRPIKHGFARLANNWRKHSWHAALKGYLWKMQYGLMSGYYIHVVLIADAMRLPHPEEALADISAAWQTITEHTGEIHDTSHESSPYFSGGTGLWIPGSKRQKRSELNRGLKYLLSKDEYFRVRTVQTTSTIFRTTDRIFGRSLIRERSIRTSGKSRAGPLGAVHPLDPRTC